MLYRKVHNVITCLTEMCRNREQDFQSHTEHGEITLVTTQPLTP